MNALFKKIMLAAVVLALSISTVYAKPGGYADRSGCYAGGVPFRGMLQQLDLTAEQQGKIDVIMEKYRSEFRRQADRGAFHSNMMEIVKAEQFNTQQAKALIDARDALRKDNKLKRMQMMFDVYHSLSAEQKAKMDLLFAQHQQQMLRRGRCAGQGPGLGKGPGAANNSQ